MRGAACEWSGGKGPWRRELGIWCGLAAAAHVAVILDGWVQWDLARLFWDYHGSSLGWVLDAGPFGLGNLVGIVAILYTACLVATSNDWSTRLLGASAWKFVQQRSYTLLSGRAAHGFFSVLVRAGAQLAARFWHDGGYQGVYVNARAIIERKVDGETDILLQVRDRPGEARRWELPGGQLEEYEPILAALAREIREETGLALTRIVGDAGRTVWEHGGTAVECLTPFFVYQTLRGPVDSVGFFFRCEAEGELTGRGDGAYGHQWVRLEEVRRRFGAEPVQFDWLTQAALQHYLDWREATGRELS